MQTIDTKQLAELGEQATVIDVRERDEFSAVRIPWASNVPLSELTDRVDEVPEDGPVYLICAAGVRSERAAAYLEQQGKPVVNVLGGMSEWAGSGFTVERD
ncbi:MULTISPECIES: rhodanese-like domain-containing protein [unclassified Pseudoclavibacter]|uniref:rhodanese-like domain-containing protein n=1 Tax=unclassified Pseudoclavibacter TaxID=2615177 RepID=UPI000CE863BA|nr:MULTISPECIES: rhodanese-like domain-containing protein [unclassified Pseudoclavibacter]MBS3179955.1 rhodanese-like domain-containing protein [Pseudoclavibacter sp. Marseille-Q4354]PPG33405.1 sulfurtransferase [Pseudoclavibacter sp. RFBB5]